MKKRFLYLILSLSLAWITPVRGQSADSIITLNIKARGGIQRLEHVKSVRMKGETSLQSMQAPFSILLKRPDKMRLEVRIHKDTLVQAYNGKIAWTIIPNPNGQNQLQKLSPVQANDLKDQADIDGPLIHYKQKGFTVQYAGKSEVNHHQTYKLRLTAKNGTITTIHIDTSSYYTISETSIKKIKSNPSSPLPDRFLRVTTYFKDYRNTDGIMLPYRVQTIVDGQKISDMMIDTIVLNVEAPDRLFDYPANPVN